MCMLAKSVPFTVALFVTARELAVVAPNVTVPLREAVVTYDDNAVIICVVVE